MLFQPASGWPWPDLASGLSSLPLTCFLSNLIFLVLVWWLDGWSVLLLALSLLSLFDSSFLPTFPAKTRNTPDKHAFFLVAWCRHFAFLQAAFGFGFEKEGGRLQSGGGRKEEEACLYFCPGLLCFALPPQPVACLFALQQHPMLLACSLCLWQACFGPFLWEEGLLYCVFF